MALRECPDCGREVSSLAAACPHCGRPLRDEAATSAEPGGRSGLSAGTTTAVRLFLGFGAALSGAAAIAQVREIGVFEEWWLRSGDVQALVDAEELTAAFTGFAGFSGIVLLILLMVWGNKAYWQGRQARPTGEKWSPGWAVGGWFVPFANLIIPKLVLNEIDRITHPDNGPAPIGASWRERPVLSAGRLWWWFSVAGLVLVVIGGTITGEQVASLTSFDGETYRTGLWFVAIGLGVGGASQVAGITYFKQLGERLHP